MQADLERDHSGHEKKEKKRHAEKLPDVVEDPPKGDKKSKKRKRDRIAEGPMPQVQVEADASDVAQAQGISEKAARKKRKKEMKAVTLSASDAVPSEQVTSQPEATIVAAAQDTDDNSQIDPTLLEDLTEKKKKKKKKHREKEKEKVEGAEHAVDDSVDIVLVEPPKTKKKKKKEKNKETGEYTTAVQPAQSFPNGPGSQSSNFPDLDTSVTSANPSSMAFFSAVLSALGGQPDSNSYSIPPAEASYAQQPTLYAGLSTTSPPHAYAPPFQDPQVSDVFFNELAANMQAMGVNGDLTDPVKIAQLLRSLGVSPPGSVPPQGPSQPLPVSIPDVHLGPPSTSGKDYPSHRNNSDTQAHRQQLAIEAAMAPTPIGQKPVTADKIRTLQDDDDNVLPSSGNISSSAQNTRPAHQHLLATKWMKASDLNDMVLKEGESSHSPIYSLIGLNEYFTGLVYKKGKFSAIEDEQLRVARDNYRVVRHLDICPFCSSLLNHSLAEWFDRRSNR
jgi:hypothetical protein